MHLIVTAFRKSYLASMCCIAVLAWPTVANAVEIQGFTEPYQDIDVAAAEAGIVEAIHVSEGDRVHENQLLLQLDSDVAEVTLRIAESIKESRGRLESATEELALHTDTLDKLRRLYSRQHASHQEVERATTQMRIAQSQLKTVHEELRVKTLEYERAQLQLERRQIRSPIDGIVIRVFKNRGESIFASEPIVVKVVQLDPLLAVFLVPLQEAQELKTKSTIGVRIGASTKLAQGTVEFVSPAADPQSGLTRVRVRIANPDEQLQCGVTCYLLLDTASSPQLANVNP